MPLPFRLRVNTYNITFKTARSADFNIWERNMYGIYSIKLHAVMSRAIMLYYMLSAFYMANASWVNDMAATLVGCLSLVR